MNWKQIYERQNAKTYVMPAGWTEQAKVARSLGCAPERVNERLGPSIKAGEVEAKQFPIWDRLTKRVIRVFGYREIVKQQKNKPAKK